MINKRILLTVNVVLFLLMVAVSGQSFGMNADDSKRYQQPLADGDRLMLLELATKYDLKSVAEKQDPVEKSSISSVASVSNNNFDQRYEACFTAIQKNDIETIKKEIAAGLPIDGEHSKAKTPLLAGAAFAGKKEIVEYLLSNGADAEKTDNIGMTAFMYAVQEGQKDIVDYFLEKKLVRDINLESKQNVSAFMLACAHKHLDIAEILRKNGADINAMDHAGISSLMWAAKENDRAVVEYLLSIDADILIEDQDGWTAFGFAVDKGNYELAQLILEKTLKNSGNNEKILASYLFYVAHSMSGSSQDILKRLFAAGAKPDMQYGDGTFLMMVPIRKGQKDILEIFITELKKGKKNETLLADALNEATIYASPEMVTMILDAGADVNALTSKKSSPFINAVGNGLLAIAKIMVARGVNIHTRLINNLMPVAFAARYGHYEMVEYLLSLEKNDESRKKNALAAFDAAIEAHEYVVVEKLFDQVNDQLSTDYKQRLLSFAILNKLPVLAQSVLHHKDVNANVLVDGKNSLLSQAVKLDNPALVKLLLTKGADINYVGSEGLTPLMLASKNGCWSAVEVLAPVLKARAQKNTKKVKRAANYELKVSLLWAACEGHAKVVEKLIDEGVNPDSCIDDQSGTIIGEAAQRGHYEVVKTLINKGAKLDAKSVNGLTALHKAVIGNHVDVVKLLLDSGANHTIRSNDNHEPLTLAIMTNKSDVVRVLVRKLNDREIANAIWFAVANNQYEMVRLLLGAAETVSITQLALAFKSGKQDNGEIADKIKKLVTVKVTHQIKKLFHAISANNLVEFEKCLAVIDDPTVYDYSKETVLWMNPLHRAINRFIEIKNLIESKKTATENADQQILELEKAQEAIITIMRILLNKDNNLLIDQNQHGITPLTMIQEQQMCLQLRATFKNELSRAKIALEKKKNDQLSAERKKKREEEEKFQAKAAQSRKEVESSKKAALAILSQVNDETTNTRLSVKKKKEKKSRNVDANKGAISPGIENRNPAQPSPTPTIIASSPLLTEENIIDSTAPWQDVADEFTREIERHALSGGPTVPGTRYSLTEHAIHRMLTKEQTDRLKQENPNHRTKKGEPIADGRGISWRDVKRVLESGRVVSENTQAQTQELSDGVLNVVVNAGRTVVVTTYPRTALRNVNNFMPIEQILTNTTPNGGLPTQRIIRVQPRRFDPGLAVAGALVEQKSR